MNTRKVTKEGIVVTSSERGEILTRQTVLVAGPNALVKPGDEIEISTANFKKKFIHPKNGIGADYEVTLPPIEIIDKKEYLFLSSNDIKYIYLNE